MDKLSSSLMGLTLSVALVAGCGGKVTFENTAASGSGGTSATSGTHGATTTNVGQTSTVVSGVTGSTVATTNGSVSVAATTGSGPNSCSNFGFNGINSGCSQEGLTCQVPYACCGMSAICKNGIWRAEGPLCNQPCLTCGPSPFGCQGGAVCVVDQTQLATGASYQCAKDPCPPGQLNCGCAASVCQQNFLSCASANQATVTCDCPNCGG